MKKFMNFIGEGVPRADQFLYDIRRVQTRSDFFKVCHAHLDHDAPMSLEPAVLAGVPRAEEKSEICNS